MMHGRERGTKTRVARKANVVERMGYAVYVGSGKVCTVLLRVKSVQDYETIPSIKNNGRFPPRSRERRRCRCNGIQIAKIKREENVYGHHRVVTTRAVAIEVWVSHLIVPAAWLNVRS